MESTNAQGVGTAAPAQRKPLKLSDVQLGLDETIKIPLRNKRDRDSLDVGYVVLKNYGPKIIRKYRSIYYPGQGRKEQPAQANAYLIEECFVRFENLEVPWQEEGFESEKEWFARSEEGQKLAEIVLGRFIGETLPDTTDIKE